MTTVEAVAELTPRTPPLRRHFWLWRDSWTEATRHLKALPRNPELLVFAVLQPIMFVVLFVYVFGGSINVPGYSNYKQYVIPGIFAQTVLVRIDLHRARHRRGLEEGLHRPAALAADVRRRRC